MTVQANATRSQRVWYMTLRGICALGFVFLLAPIVVIIPISFNEGSFLNYPLIQPRRMPLRGCLQRELC